MVSRCERDARWVVHRRAQNEWIIAAWTSFGADHLTWFVCECAGSKCDRRISLTDPEYDQEREHSTHFALALDHENPESDAIISECARYAVVNTVEPFAVRISRETDVRSLSKAAS